MLADRNLPHNNEEDWAAKARAWAAAKSANESHTQSQYMPIGRMEEHGHIYIQFDASFIPHTAMPLHPGTNFGRISGPNFQPVTAPFGMGTGVPLHSAAAFPGEANGAYSLSERPKKAAVPNWLREEIIKKKAVIASSIQDNPTEDDYQSLEVGNTDKSSRKVDQADSNRSNEDDDNEEDIETARTAAINQEIKRVLTEILLKVTDELFDEIATKVVSEDDPGSEDDQVIKSAKVKVSLPSVSTTPRTSMQVSVPAIVKDTRADGDDESSNPSSPGNLLGLANYASDDEENERQPESKKGFNHEVVKDNRQDSGKDKRTVSKVDNDRKRERPRGEKEGLSVQRVGRDSQKSKVHRSPSPGSRGRSKRDNSIGSRGSGSGDESSKNARTRCIIYSLPLYMMFFIFRQVSRSPHRKHSQRRHSPFPSHEVR
ncbi:hypothetical protein QJS04_geneDACA017388 [Acorus gramineus]|uniref:Uncharacterized protein n=1 Tax=Acorus gramineus TaxID=55184 RepID=A0AAV9A0N0_ACOGR|nr:hypothetical protein QJS04_geneDACA024162 [Acorus gramineus]KAK1257903.1 hypothetical protein QJS04_geneDACA017388 [Acorus gramineus]